MNALATQQLALKHAIVHAADDVSALLRGDAQRQPLLHVYQHAYTARLAGALRDNYAVLPHVLGDEGFDALAHAYVAAHPSRRPSIRWFGDRLPEFMAAHEELVPHPAIVDLAKMEWALRSAFDAADGHALDGAALAEVPAEGWPSLVLEPLPSVQLIALEWNVEPVWRALQAVEDGEAPELPEPQAHAHELLVWRSGLETRWRSLDAPAARLLHAAVRGETFTALCLLAATDVGEAQAALHAASALRGWIDDGLFGAWCVAADGR